MAAFGVGFVNVLSPNRERYMHQEIKTEQVQKKDDEIDSESEAE